jgi:hypothetical protein
MDAAQDGLRSNRGRAPMQQFACIEKTGANAVYMPLHGFTAVDLGAEAARLFKKPNRNSRPHNARLSAAHSRPGIDAREVISKLLDDPLQQLRLLAA